MLCLWRQLKLQDTEGLEGDGSEWIAGGERKEKREKGRMKRRNKRK
jgi:hypothetical protein